MAQVKKKSVRDSILRNADDHFHEHGYVGASMAAIARSAGISPSNLYVYFPSKLSLFYEIYGPRLTAQLIRLHNTISRLDDNRQKLTQIFTTLWVEIPAEDNCFARNLIEGIATSPKGGGAKPTELLKWASNYVNDMVLECLPESRRPFFTDGNLTYLTFMAFDGFAINAGQADGRDASQIVEQYVGMIMGDEIASGARKEETGVS